MRTRGSVTGRHVAIAVLVMIVVNAQLTWWIIFSTGQARERLELERALLETRARAWADVALVAGPDFVQTLPEDLEVVVDEGTASPRPSIALGEEFSGRVVRPTRESWDGVLEEVVVDARDREARSDAAVGKGTFRNPQILN